MDDDLGFWLDRFYGAWRKTYNEVFRDHTSFIDRSNTAREGFKQKEKEAKIAFDKIDEILASLREKK